MAGAQDTHATSAVALLVGATVFADPGRADLARGRARRGRTSSPRRLLELAYFALLAAAYSRADYTFAYPIARGVAPVLVLVVSVAALGARRERRRRALGVLLVAGGVLLVRGVARRGPTALAARARRRRRASPPTRWSTTTASRHASPLPYFECVLLICALPYAARRRLLKGRGALRAAVDRRSLPAGLGMVGAYVLVLAALERAEAAPVAALRETSVVMAAGGAAIAGRERVPPAAAGRRHPRRRRDRRDRAGLTAGFSRPRTKRQRPPSRDERDRPGLAAARAR